jgi:hypothetical protein
MKGTNWLILKNILVLRTMSECRTLSSLRIHPLEKR